jgi:hypothetical protein
MSSKYTITEPHPTVAKNSYMQTGRGGAGNLFRAPATIPSSGVPTPAVTTSSRHTFYSGRGGAGNAVRNIVSVPLDLDNEVSRQTHRDSVQVGHVGRGGAGNFFDSNTTSSGQSAASGSVRRSSGDSGDSARSGFWARLSSHHSRN